MRPPLGAIDGDAFTAGMLGLAVERATATLPQTTNAPIFTVAGGCVLVFQLFGRVTTIIQAQANNTKITAVPTIGSSVDLCAVADINGLEVGGSLILANVAATALLKNNAGATFGAYGFTLVSPGTINLNCAASNTGSIRWTLYYAPDDVGATVVAA